MKFFSALCQTKKLMFDFLRGRRFEARFALFFFSVSRGISRWDFYDFVFIFSRFLVFPPSVLSHSLLRIYCFVSCFLQYFEMSLIFGSIQYFFHVSVAISYSGMSYAISTDLPPLYPVSVSPLQVECRTSSIPVNVHPTTQIRIPFNALFRPPRRSLVTYESNFGPFLIKRLAKVAALPQPVARATPPLPYGCAAAPWFERFFLFISRVQ